MRGTNATPHPADAPTRASKPPHTHKIAHVDMEASGKPRRFVGRRHAEAAALAEKEGEGDASRVVPKAAARPLAAASQVPSYARGDVCGREREGGRESLEKALERVLEGF